MAKYTIQDPQSGKTITLEGDSPPSESDIEQVFNQSGVREKSTVLNKLQQNPISNFLLGNSLRTFQDIGAGYTANKTQGVRQSRNQEAFNQAQKLQQSAQISNDPVVKKKLLSQANDIYKQVSDSESEVSKSFSSDVTQNPAWRGLKSGAEIGNLAELITQTPAIAKSIYKAGKFVIHPFQAVGDIKSSAINQADRLGNQLDMQKVLDTVKQARTTTSATDLPTFDTNIDKLASQAKDTPYMSAKDAAQLYKNLNDAFTRTGLPKTGADNAFDLLEKSAIKSQLPEDVLKANKLFTYLYGAQRFGKKLTSPLVLGPLAASLGGSYALIRALGNLGR